MKPNDLRISTVERPYALTFPATGTRYLLTSIEAQRLIDAYPAVTATRNRVVLQGTIHRTILQAATIGGGPAFIVERVR